MVPDRDLDASCRALECTMKLPGVNVDISESFEEHPREL
jgi:hypothetical protein